MITSFCCSETENLFAWHFNPCPDNFCMKIYFICFWSLFRQTSCNSNMSVRKNTGVEFVYINLTPMVPKFFTANTNTIKFLFFVMQADKLRLQHECEKRLDITAGRYEERITELHSVIAELRKKIERHQINVIRYGGKNLGSNEWHRVTVNKIIWCVHALVFQQISIYSYLN